MIKMTFLTKRCLSAAVATFFAMMAPAWAQSLDCSGNWMMTTNEGHVFVGSAIQSNYAFEFKAKAGDRDMILRGSLDPTTGNVNLFREDRPDILFQGTIEPNCGQIRGTYKVSREEEARHYVMTRTAAAAGATPVGLSNGSQAANQQSAQSDGSQQATIAKEKDNDGWLGNIFDGKSGKKVDIKNDRLNR